MEDLRNAVRQGNKVLLSKLLAKGEEPLRKAVRQGNKVLLSKLLAKGEEPLSKAVRQGNIDLLSKLLAQEEKAHLAKIEETAEAAKAAKKAAKKAKAAAKAAGEENASDQEAKDAKEVLNAAKVAAEKAAKEAEAEAQKAKKDWDKYRYQTDQDGHSLLHVAAGYDNVKVVQTIYEKLPKGLIRKKNKREETPLHIAAVLNKTKVVECLLDLAEAFDNENNRSERTVEITNRSGNTAFHEAVLERNWEVIEAFTKWNTGVIFWKNEYDKTPIYIAAEQRWKDMLDKLLIDGALETQSTNKNIHKGPGGRTPLHAAVYAKSTKCVKTILEKMKELIDKADDTGSNPLHYAASLGRYKAANCILNTEGSFAAHQKDKKGLYPIHIAASRGHTRILKDIADTWPKVMNTLTEKENQNVLHLAAKNGRSDSVRYILSYVVFSYGLEELLNAEDTDGNTPLHLATIHSHPEVVSILIAEREVDKTIVNGKGLTALDIADERRMAGTLTVLELATLTAYWIATTSFGRHSPSTKGDKSRKSIRDYMDDYIKRFENIDIVAALIITVTFAASFTVPGGFTSDGSCIGMAVLLRKPAFNVFVICDTMAFYLSIIVVVNNISARLVNNIFLFSIASKISLMLLAVALIMTAVAFGAGLYSVILKLDWLAIAILVMGGTLLLYIVFLLVLFRFRKVTCVSHCLQRSILQLFMLTFDE